MRITQWGEYGIHCAVYVAQRMKEGVAAVNAADIAGAQGIAIDYAQQILQRLRKAGIIESVRGPTGGYKLTKSPSDISLKDVLIASEADTFDIICDTKPIGHERCGSDKACALKPVWHSLKQHIDSFLSEHSLQGLLDSAKPGLCTAPETTVQINGTTSAAN